MATRSGVSSVGSNEGIKAKELECDVGLGLRMQSKESCRGIYNHHHHHQASQLISSSSCSGGGPLFYGRSNPVACFGDLCDVVVGGGSTSGATNAVTESKTTLPPFYSPPFTFSSSGEMTPSMNAAVPFTAAQWQELERQTMIYKYMMASVPVPPELLIPITKTQSNTPIPQSHVVKGSLELGISSCNSDPEPWRCKRTDGKKWRCSRDVAPDQKYCERHSHKSRPRSRKPVELQTDSMANTESLSQKTHFPSQTNSHLSIFSSPMVSAATSYNQPRSLEWFLKGETVPVASSNSNQEWRYMKGDERLYNFQQHYREGQLQLDSNSYMHMNMNLRGRHSHPLQAHRLNDNCSLLLSPKSTSDNQTRQAQETRHFLDSWSSAVRDSNTSNYNGEIGNECSVSTSDQKLLPISSLSLSMAGGTQTNEENESEQCACFGIMGSEKEGVGVFRPQWMTHGPWMGSPPGGPLAEALCLGISSVANTDSNLVSSHGSSYGNTAGRH